MWFDCVLWMLRRYNILFGSMAGMVDETEGKRGLTLDVMFHSMQRLVHFVA